VHVDLPTLIVAILNLLAWAYFVGCLRTTVNSNSDRLKRIEGMLDFHLNGGVGGWQGGPAKSKKRGE
jgi:hypothetical protein